ncbi:Neurotransmitter-gated ion-channel ligand-binding domain [Trinorchestia longiramus]|nr:Neurotransmitter-gated ion-channel ligand-binding domain [Trinorchestia longiramus]
MHKDLIQPLDLNDPNLVKAIWKPEVYFPNAKHAEFQFVTVPNVLVRINPHGEILYMLRLKLLFACMMELSKFPLDTQVCTMEIASFSKTMQELVLQWKATREPIKMYRDLRMPQFQMQQIVATACQEASQIGGWLGGGAGPWPVKRFLKLVGGWVVVEGHSLPIGFLNCGWWADSVPTPWLGNYSCLVAEFHLQRSVGFHLVQSYLPTILIVAISWVSFWMDVDSVPGRTTLGVTTLLTVSTKSSGIQGDLPQVSYVKAIDVWMGACTAFVFCALLEFTLVNYLWRKTPGHGPPLPPPCRRHESPQSCRRRCCGVKHSPKSPQKPQFQPGGDLKSSDQHHLQHADGPKSFQKPHPQQQGNHKYSQTKIERHQKSPLEPQLQRLPEAKFSTGGHMGRKASEATDDNRNKKEQNFSSDEKRAPQPTEKETGTVCCEETEKPLGYCGEEINSSAASWTSRRMDDAPSTYPKFRGALVTSNSNLDEVDRLIPGETEKSTSPSPIHITRNLTFDDFRKFQFGFPDTEATTKSGATKSIGVFLKSSWSQPTCITKSSGVKTTLLDEAFVDSNDSNFNVKVQQTAENSCQCKDQHCFYQPPYRPACELEDCSENENPLHHFHPQYVTRNGFPCSAWANTQWKGNQSSKIWARKIDEYCRGTFPLLFGIFNICYWTHYLYR